ncbi:sporulation delaying protein family toxin [Myxococcus xanthus]|uniref:Sporulation delaying protein family toxin n=1 Tax=Myxococcus xanthus TaxID=34 RepID=A0A7Y4MR37_MYXXA|nr:sporulation delaying protein family toxin [Myxococcus xanthus]NOJ78103.1 sporulation delaying protein family toxin [Myxococcus xanthus]NOJ85102.1 sporulation delaying protein family toxin [Myxococcus xanthus]
MKRSTLKLTSAATALISLSTFGVGCGPSDNGAAVRVAQNPAQSGQSLFKGMAFGLGPDAHHFDDIWQRPEIKERLGEDTLAKREQAAESVIAKMAQLDAAFFERFNKDLRSGNHLVVDQLLTDTRTLVMSAVNELAKTGDQEGGVGIGSMEHVQAGLTVYIETAAAVILLVFLFITQFDMTPVMESEASRLKRDVWVDMLVKKFAPAE